MFYLGYVFGVITSGVLLSLGFCAQRYFQMLEDTLNEVPETQGTINMVPAIFRRKQEKKKPKYISEEEEARREKPSPPIDPGLG